MKKTGFTLIELLIVIAIILILIAIALPNFLEAQIRAKITKVKGDMRTIATAQESYRIDFAMYTDDHDPDSMPKGLHQLTTPLKYLPSLPIDPFSTTSGLRDPRSAEIGWELASTGRGPFAGHLVKPPHNTNAFALTSIGTDGGDSFGCNDSWPFCSRTNPCPGDGWMTYAPTNGTKSAGDIVQLGGEHRAGSYCIDNWDHVRGHYPLR
jgi:prepilin-type N-terminal cleavage/methylation domain-containing protein